MPREYLSRTPEKALTAQFVKSVKEPGKYFDGNGLYLRVSPNGSRCWVQRIVIRGKRSEIGLGAPPMVPLADARARAIENRRLAMDGGDPLAARREARAILTFEEAARKVYELNAPSWQNRKHAAQFLSTLETYVFPLMGRVKVSEVTSADILAVLTPIWVQKAETASRVRQRISLIMKWGIAQGWRKDNPALGLTSALPKQTEPRERRKALPYDAVGDCISAVRASRAGDATKLCFEFLVLTCSRSLEARGARWDEIDFDARAWNVPASRMKMKRPHRVPLSGRTLDLLHEAGRISGHEGLVFPGMKPGHTLSDMTLSKLVKELGVSSQMIAFLLGAPVYSWQDGC